VSKLGFGLVEIVIASAIISVSIFSLSAVAVISSQLQSQSLEKIRANFLAGEGIEAMRFLRDKSWDSSLALLNPGNNYYLSFASSTSNWSVGLVAVPFLDSFFERKITIENVLRDSNDDIVISGGTSDPDSKKVTVTVSWQDRGATSTVSLSTYLSDIFDN
jgi:hypothetical protein